MDPRIPNPPLDPAALHALHVGSLGGDGATMAPALRLALDAAFGSVDALVDHIDWAAVHGRYQRAVHAASEVVVYCVHGQEVSRATALRLRAAGLDARYLRGGIDGWQAAGRPLVDKPPGAQRP